MADEPKPPVVPYNPLYEQKLQFTPEGTVFKRDLTPEGRKKAAENIRDAAASKDTEDFTKTKLTTVFNPFARDRTRDRDDFER